MLMKVRHDLLEVGFVKVPRDDKGSIGVFVNVAIEHIMKLGQSQASVCLWWNVNSSNNDRLNLAGSACSGLMNLNSVNMTQFNKQ